MTSITCDLLAPLVQPLDLTPLQALPSLGSLLLESGAFSNIHVLAHLTELVISNAAASAHEDCSFASGLRILASDNATIHGFHSQGLVACRELQLLACYGSAVETSGVAESLNTFIMSAHFPASFSLLISLSEVQIELKGPCIADISFPLFWASQLRSLQVLSIVNDVRVHITNDLSKLTNLVS